MLAFPIPPKNSKSPYKHYTPLLIDITCDIENFSVIIPSFIHYIIYSPVHNAFILEKDNKYPWVQLKQAPNTIKIKANNILRYLFNTNKENIVSYNIVSIIGYKLGKNQNYCVILKLLNINVNIIENGRFKYAALSECVKLEHLKDKTETHILKIIFK